MKNNRRIKSIGKFSSLVLHMCERVSLMQSARLVEHVVEAKLLICPYSSSCAQTKPPATRKPHLHRSIGLEPQAPEPHKTDR